MALVDNDVVKKIAVMDLLDEFQGLTVCGDGVLLLPTARFSLGPKSGTVKKVRKTYGEAVSDRLVTYVSAAEAFSGDIALLGDIAGVDDIDEGEAAMFSAAVELASHHVLTGDKRSIKALATAPNADGVRDALQGRVMCLEQVMWALVDEHGLKHVYGQAHAGVSCDKAMQVIFGSARDNDLEAVTRAFRHYITEVRDLANGLLHPLEPNPE